MARDDTAPTVTIAQAAPQGPGALRTHARITIHTLQAQALYLGRKREPDEDGKRGKPGIIGLDGFARLAVQLSGAAAADDPYADLALLKIEAALALAEKAVRADIRQLTGPLEAMASASDIEVDLAESVAPIQLPFMVSSPYGMKGAHLLHDFDELMRTVLTAQKCALADRVQVYNLVLRAGRPVRRTFALPLLNWRFTGVTRADVRKDTGLAQMAKAVYALLKITDIPADVLQGVQRPRFAPAIRKGPPPPVARTSYLDLPEEGA
jgi:integrating conjugative element protein (TIGR03761 family)